LNKANYDSLVHRSLPCGNNNLFSSSEISKTDGTTVKMISEENVSNVSKVVQALTSENIGNTMQTLAEYIQEAQSKR